ncbi:MAG: hypothetical protein JWO08_4392 [Verrucomicrobiaceae bacterium]|nr:hypothetical protein [Verrucomicrobiaceae bacterium]
MNRLVDTQHLLHLRDSVRLETLFDEFERRFPQAFCTVFLGILPHGVSTAEGGFWLLNHGVRTCQDEIRPNDYGIALVIDPSTHSASLCLGYSLETVITHENTAELLRQISPALWHGDYANAITKMVKGVDKLLRKYGQPRRRPSLIDARKPRSLFGFKHTTPEKSPVEVDK